jgi:hypothetical protein
MDRQGVGEGSRSITSAGCKARRLGKLHLAPAEADWPTGPAERARREATYASGREAGWARQRAEREAKEAAKAARKTEREAQATERSGLVT